MKHYSLAVWFLGACCCSSTIAMKTFALTREPWKTFDPFLFCAYHKDAYPAGDANMEAPTATFGRREIGSDFSGLDGWSMYHGSGVPGFPQHPHRGFETVTVSRTGLVDHFDSLGMTGRYGDGDVQWMTAGGGILHSEMFPLRHTERPNPAELFQLWLNLPRDSKLVPPTAKMFWNEEVPVVKFDGATVRVIAGSLEGVSAREPPPNSFAHRPDAHVGIFEVAAAGGAATLPPRLSGVRRMVYVVNGSLRLNGEAVGPMTGCLMPEEAPVTVAGTGFALVLEGRPIGEPVVQHGPFVMNTEDEIRQTFAEFRRTQFGGWPWPKSDPTHPRDAGRHVKHRDGRVERPPTA